MAANTRTLASGRTGALFRLLLTYLLRCDIFLWQHCPSGRAGQHIELL